MMPVPVEGALMTAAEETYFQLLDSCAGLTCAVCAVLRSAVVEKVAAETVTVRGSGQLLRGACGTHARLVATHLRSHESSLRQVLAYLRASRSGILAPRRWQILRRRRAGSERCRLCRFVERREPRVCGSLLAALDEMQFVRAFRTAAPICLTHEPRLLRVQEKRAAEFAQIQHAKLATLSDRLLRHEIARDDTAAVETVARYFAVDEAVSPYAGGEQLEVLAEADAAPTAAPESFEVAKLRREVQDLTHRLGDAESRAAALHYRVAILSEENRDWEMRYTGLASEARGLEADLRAARSNGEDKGDG
jgi:hypothetical protein